MISQANLEGGCHCGNLGFVLHYPDADVGITARTCDCSFCRACAARWISPRGGALELRVREPALESQYTFGTHSAVFHVCARCGAVPSVTCSIEGSLYAVVNLNSVRGVLPQLASADALELGDETLQARLARRKRSWIGDVRLVRAGQAQEPPAPAFRLERTILFGDCDPAGVIYTPRVADFVVEAALAFVSDRLGRSAARYALDSRVWPPARLLSIEYLSPLTYDQRIELTVQVEQLRERSTTLLVIARTQSQQLAFRGRLVQVFVSAENFQRVPVPAELRARLST